SAVSPVFPTYAPIASKYHNAASTVLYPGSPPSSGNMLGTRPYLTYLLQAARISAASSYLPVSSVSPGSEIIVSLPQSVNQGYPAMMVFEPVERLFTIKWSALLTSIRWKSFLQPAVSAM